MQNPISTVNIISLWEGTLYLLFLFRKIVLKYDQIKTLLRFSMFFGSLSRPGNSKTFVKFPVDKKIVDGKLYSFEIVNYDTNLTGLLDEIE